MSMYQELKQSLTEAEWTALMLMMGYATSAARANRDEYLYKSFIRLANRINADNPNWKTLAEDKQPAGTTKVG